jgi:hypothetical protein
MRKNHEEEEYVEITMGHRQTLTPAFCTPIFSSFLVRFERPKQVWVSQAKLYKNLLNFRGKGAMS